VAGAVPVLLEAGGSLTDPDGRTLFPLDAPQSAGVPFALLAGNSAAHRQALDDLRH
jgi:fructose-1,6-bisphosphatase/inositol monophosphatase family enzyme